MFVRIAQVRADNVKTEAEPTFDRDPACLLRRGDGTALARAVGLQVPVLGA